MKKFLSIISILSLASILAACSTNPASGDMKMNTTNQTITDHSGMTHSMTISSDKDFINQMVPHHQEAIETSEIIIAKTSNPELKKFAENVIKAQNLEVNQMNQWSVDWFGSSVEKVMYMAMMPDLTKLEGDALDRAYIAGMIGHHEGAIKMAQEILPITTRPELKTLAENIINSQTEEVKTLNSWLK